MSAAGLVRGLQGLVSRDQRPRGRPWQDGPSQMIGVMRHSRYTGKGTKTGASPTKGDAYGACEAGRQGPSRQLS